MNIYWNVLDTKRITTTGLVTEVYYKVTCFSGDIFEIKTGKVELVGDINSPDFIPFENLNESNILEWVKEKLDGEVITVESKLKSSVSKRSNQFLTNRDKGQSISKGLPWNNYKN